MPRNEAKILSDTEERCQRLAVARLTSIKAAEKPVTVTYVKRSGQTSRSTGMVGEFSGKPGFDTGSVTIHTEDKGPRTINLHRIIGYVE